MNKLRKNNVQWIIVAALLTLSININANDLTSNNSKAVHQMTESCQQLVIAEVNGLVCDFCARALEKVFNKRSEVYGIDVNLDKGQVEIQFKHQQRIDDALLTKLITDSGYNVVKLTNGCEQ